MDKKTCSKCGETKSVGLFSRRSDLIRFKDGRNSWCKACDSANRNAWISKNRNRLNTYLRERRNKNHAMVLIIERRSKAKHKESRRAYNAKWSAENLEKHRALRKAWKANNPFKNRQYKLRRKAIAAGLESDFTAEQWLMVLEIFGGKCAYCGDINHNRESIHQDHFISVANGGGYTMGNIVPACRRCNCGKANRDKEWIVRHFGQPKYNEVVTKLDRLRGISHG